MENTTVESSNFTPNNEFDQNPDDSFPTESLLDLSSYASKVNDSNSILSIRRQFSCFKDDSFNTNSATKYKARRCSFSITDRSSHLHEESCNLNLKHVRQLVENAMQKNKIFVIQGRYPSIREAFKRRGWIEKFINPKAAQYGPPVAPLKIINNIHVDELFIINQNRSKPARNSSFTDGSSSDDDIDFDEDNDQTLGRRKRVLCYNGNFAKFLELFIQSKMLKYTSPNFIWSLRKGQVNMSYLKKDQIFNHFPSAPFTTKIGLYRCLQDVRWVKETSNHSFFPRCYTLTEEDEKQAFIEDFRLTACMGIIRIVKNLPFDDFPQIGMQEKTFIHTISVNDKNHLSESRELTPQGDAPLECFFMENFAKYNYSSARFQQMNPNQIKCLEAPEDVIKFAIIYVKNYLNVKNHCDIDNSKPLVFLSPDQWKRYLSWTYKIYKNRYKIANAQQYVYLSQLLYTEFVEKHDQESIDGYRNVWIVKPGAKSRGRGIECYEQLESILKFPDTSIPVCGNKFIVQKYIERPLLIHNTKFDIRQWFMITDWNPLTIWWYKPCYLRFCSHEFTLDNLDESVHLSNNSIQNKYKINRASNEIPSFNMWYLHEFLDFLRKIDKENYWLERVLPGMKEAVINSMLCSQSNIEPRRNSFELYGADFMISEQDFRPWLIEINSSPCMAPSTEVTALLTSKVLEDVIKVIIDRRLDRNADTGDFEMIYRQNIVTTPMYLGMDLTVNGVKVYKPQKNAIRNPYLAKTSIVTRDDTFITTIPINNFEISTKSENIKRTSQIRSTTSDLNNNEPLPILESRKKNTSISRNQFKPLHERKNTTSIEKVVLVSSISKESADDSRKIVHKTAIRQGNIKKIPFKQNVKLYNMTKVEIVSAVPKDNDILQHRPVKKDISKKVETTTEVLEENIETSNVFHSSSNSLKCSSYVDSFLQDTQAIKKSISCYASKTHLCEKKEENMKILNNEYDDSDKTDKRIKTKAPFISGRNSKNIENNEYKEALLRLRNGFRCKLVDTNSIELKKPTEFLNRRCSSSRPKLDVVENKSGIVLNCTSIARSTSASPKRLQTPKIKDATCLFGYSKHKNTCTSQTYEHKKIIHLNDFLSHRPRQKLEKCLKNGIGLLPVVFPISSIHRTPENSSPQVFKPSTLKDRTYSKNEKASNYSTDDNSKFNGPVIFRFLSYQVKIRMIELNLKLKIKLNFCSILI